MTSRFTALKVAQTGSAHAIPSTAARLVDNALSLLFDDSLRSKVPLVTTVPDRCHDWRLAVLDVQLPTPTRRLFVVQIRAAMHAVHGRTLVRVSCEGRTTSRQLLARNEPKSADHTVILHIRRSTQLRDRLQLQIWTEANVGNTQGEAEATVDSVDVLAR